MVVDGPPVASVVIPARNVAHILPRQLAALARQSFRGGFEVIVADNGSTDGTAASALEAPERPARLRVVSAAERRGISHARNVGAREAQGSLLLFCDADDIVSEAWVEHMVNGLRRFDLAGGRLEYGLLNDATVLSWRNAAATDELPEAHGWLRFAVGANFGIRKDVFDALGGCDESFVICGDDVDLSWRVQLASRSLGFVEGAIVHYQLRADLKALARQQFLYGFNEVRLFKKFKKDGVPRPSLGRAVRIWWFLVSRVHTLRRNDVVRGHWIGMAALRAGRIVGALRFATPFW